MFRRGWWTGIDASAANLKVIMEPVWFERICSSMWFLYLWSDLSVSVTCAIGTPFKFICLEDVVGVSNCNCLAMEASSQIYTVRIRILFKSKPKLGIGSAKLSQLLLLNGGAGRWNTSASNPPRVIYEFFQSSAASEFVYKIKPEASLSQADFRNVRIKLLPG